MEFKEINKIIKQFNYICLTIQKDLQELEEKKDKESNKLKDKNYQLLNIISDYIKILKDERITKNQYNINCYSLIRYICNELNEIKKDVNNYYSERKHKKIYNNYIDIFKSI